MYVENVVHTLSLLSAPFAVIFNSNSKKNSRWANTCLSLTFDLILLRRHTYTYDVRIVCKHIFEKN